MPFSTFFRKYWYCFVISAVGMILTMIGMHWLDNMAIHIAGLLLLHMPWVVHSWGGDLYEMLTYDGKLASERMPVNLHTRNTGYASYSK